jgi:enamine deaminase RidA (YjgF/YER057c/UK114 family)
LTAVLSFVTNPSPPDRQLDQRRATGNWLQGAWTNTAERGIAELNEASSAPPPASATFINPETVHPPFGYSHVVEVTAGRPVYIAGQVALDPTGALVDADDIRAQTRQPPASTAVEVRRLFREDALIEVEAVAVIATPQPSA